MHAAIQMGSRKEEPKATHALELAGLLFDAGVSADAVSDEYSENPDVWTSWTALIVAAMMSSVRSGKLLIKRGANVNARDNVGNHVHLLQVTE